MKTKTLNRILCVAAILVGASCALAGPLQRADVAAEPSWVAHINCEKLRTTAIGQFLLAELDKPEAKDKLGAFQAIFSFDPRKQLHGVTVYGTSDSHEDGVLIVYADFDAERLVTLAKGANDYQSTKHNDHVIHSWIDEKRTSKNGDKVRSYAAILGNRIVLGQREAPVARALDVLDRTAPNLSSSKTFSEFAAGSDTGFLQAAARKLNVGSSDPNAAIFRLSKMLRLQVGEDKGQLTMNLSLQANDEEVAKQISSVVQGLLGLLKLQQEKPEAAKLADALSLKQEGPAILATLAVPAADVIAAMKSGVAKRAPEKSEKN